MKGVKDSRSEEILGLGKKEEREGYYSPFLRERKEKEGRGLGYFFRQRRGSGDWSCCEKKKERSHPYWGG